MHANCDPPTPPSFELANHSASIRLRGDLFSSTIEIEEVKIGPPLPDPRDWDSCEELPTLVIHQGQEGLEDSEMSLRGTRADCPASDEEYV